MDQATLSYTPYGGSITTLDLNIRGVRGAVEPDNVEVFGIIHSLLDGSKSEQNAGLRKNIDLMLDVIDSAVNRRKLCSFWLDPVRQIKSKATAPTVTAGAVTAGGTLVSGTTYYYKICTIDAVGWSAASTAVSKEAGPAGSETNCTIPLTWPAVANARCFKIFRSDDAEATYDLIDYSNTNSYSDAGTAAILEDVTVPSAVLAISVIRGSDTLESLWDNDFEGTRSYRLPLIGATIFQDPFLVM